MTSRNVADIHSEQSIRAVISLDETVLGNAERAFTKISSGSVLIPPVQQIIVDEHHGQTCIKSGYLLGDKYFVVKAASTFHENANRGLKNTSGCMLIFSAITGYVDTILMDNGYLTAIRTGAAGAVAARHLSREDSTTATILGAGLQASLQLRALCLVRPIKQARIWSRTFARSKVTAAKLTESLGFDVKAMDNLELACDDTDIIVSCTPSTVPILSHDLIAPGTHITAMGADAPGKSELSPDLPLIADAYVCDSLEQCRKYGELEKSISSGLTDQDTRYPELGEVISGQVNGRLSDHDITVCDLTGVGIQDLEIALLAKQRIESANT